MRIRTPEPLNRHRIVAAAVDVLDEQGVDGLSLRKVAGRLGCGVNSLYWHVASKEELVELAADAVLERMDLPERTGDWRRDCRRLLSRLRDVLLEHPHAVGILVTRPPLGPAALARSEWLLQALYEAGFRDTALHHAHSTLLTYTLGMVSQEVARQQSDAEREPSGATVSGMAADFPRLVELSELLRATDRGEEFRSGLDVIVDGLSLRLT